MATNFNSRDPIMSHSTIRRVVNRRSLVCCSILLVLVVRAILHQGSDYWQDANQRKVTSAQTENDNASPSKVTSTQTEVAENKKRPPSDVILISYMRSGSTFLGNMLGHLSDSFYWYEPLWVDNVFTYYRDDGQVCDYAKPVCQQTDGQAAKSLENSLRFLSDIYNCSLRNHGRRIAGKWYTDGSYAGPSWEEFRICKESKQKCLSKLEPVCQRKTHRVAKVLRLNFAYTASLLLTYPRLKAVMLLRDPRGTLNSNINTSGFPINAKNVKAGAGVFCNRIARDINAAKNLSIQFKDRVKIIQYEDFEDPRKLDILYAFLGMDHPETPIQKKLKVGHGFFSYRKSLSWKAVQAIDDECAHVYHELGLVPYRNEEHLRDLNQSVIENTLPYAL